MNPIILLLSFTAASTGLAIRAIEPMLPVFALEFGVSVPAAAKVIIVFSVAYALGQFGHGPLGDRYGKLPMITVNLLLTALALLGCGMAQDLATLTWWRFATGIVSSAAFVLGMAYIGDTVPMGERQVVIANYVIGNVLGHAFGPVLAGVVTDAFGWRATFMVLAGLFGIVGAATLAITRRHWASERRSGGALNPVASYVAVMKLPGARMIAITATVEAFFFFGAFAFVGALLKERFDLSYTAIGLALAGFGVGGLLFNVLIRVIVRRIKPRNLVVAGGLLCGVAFAAIAFLPVWQPAFALVICVGFGFYMMHNVLQTRSTEAAPQARGVGLSLFGIAWTFGQGMGVAAMGIGITAFGIAPMIAAFGAGMAGLGWWMRANFHRLP
jgi:predicted MFS family arabinose efflux permease